MTINIVKLANHNVHVRYYNTSSILISRLAERRYMPRQNAEEVHVDLTLLIHDDRTNYAVFHTDKLIDKAMASTKGMKSFRVGKYNGDYLISKIKVNINDCVMQSNANLAGAENAPPIDGLDELIALAKQCTDADALFDSEGLTYLKTIKETEIYCLNNAALPAPGFFDHASREEWEDEEENEINNDQNLGETERKQLIAARRGQGKFREKVFGLRGGRCIITGIETRELLIASHIQPWRIRDNKARLDPHNGLLLAATHDKLFDQGYITFDENGALQISDKLYSDADRAKLLPDGNMQGEFSPETLGYLEYHRKNIFKS